MNNNYVALPLNLFVTHRSFPVHSPFLPLSLPPSLGLIYNDYFALPLNLFRTRWSFEGVAEGGEAISKYPYGDFSQVYPFGIDPAWHLSDNSLLFLNSLKVGREGGREGGSEGGFCPGLSL